MTVLFGRAREDRIGPTWDHEDTARTGRVLGGPSAVVALILLLLSTFGTPARAQCLAGWLPSESVPGIGDGVLALATLPSGDVIAGGTFTTAGGVPANYIARYNPTTRVWSALGSGTNAFLWAVAVLPDGDVIAGGRFTSAGGVAANSIARYHPTTGLWSALGSGANADVHVFVVLPDGDMIVGGSFTTAGGMAANHIARYNPTTGVWSALGSGLNSTVYSLALLPGGDLIVGGEFDFAGGVMANHIARYNPTSGTWSALGEGVADSNFTSVDALAVLPGGDVIAGGNFNRAGGAAAKRIARYNPATGIWSALGAGTTDDVSAMSLLPGGDLIVGGRFTMAGGIAASKIARYNPVTGAWSALGSGISGDSEFNVVQVRALTVLPGGDVVVGGWFGSAGGVIASHIARYNPTTDLWAGRGSGMNDDVHSLAILPGGDVIIGGQFTTADGVSANHIARYNPTTRTYSALGSGINTLYSNVTALAVLPGGDVIAGGNFTMAGGVTANSIARYNPTTGVFSALSSGMGTLYPSVLALAVLPGGDVIAGGTFTMAGGVPANYIARYNPTTGVWSSLGAGTDGLVYALALLPGGDVIAGGTFTATGGTTAGYIARYNPTTRVWSTLSSGMDRFVVALAVLPDGDVIAGGNFTRAGGAAATYVARYSPTTGTWSPLGAGIEISNNGSVYALAVLPDGDVIVGGDFIRAGGVATNYISRFNPTTGVWSALGAGTNGSVRTLAVLPGGDVLAGGFFSTAGGNESAYFARYTFGSSVAKITSQPQNTSACLAGSAIFSVTATSDEPLTYQWRKDTVAIETVTNPSAATMTLMLTDLSAADVGSYDCIVTNVCGSTTTNPATLTICIGDFDCDGGADGADVGAFFGAWEAGEARSDVNADGGVDGADVDTFFEHWEAGC
ncbi:MAG: immunoglobulin domain-containing protein [Planctomycetes bacterium]|nr:immunoglobulin domain-containing protein [Planctomycetota bacterium]